MLTKQPVKKPNTKHYIGDEIVTRPSQKSAGILKFLNGRRILFLANPTFWCFLEIESVMDGRFDIR